MFFLGVKLPTRKQLATSLLDECYNEVKHKVQKHLDQSDGFYLVTDGWTNIKGSSVINYLAASPVSIILYITNNI